jgi:CRISPR/Cas system endoribonuclease Cas6 (RAMP superfamily)
MATTATKTTEIINEFVQHIDTEQEYTLNELKKILTETYKTKTIKPVKVVKVVKLVKPVVIIEDTDSDDDKPKKRGRPTKPKLDKNGNVKVKKAPTAYNIFVKQTIEALKKEQPETSAKELMGIAAAKWKALTDEEKANFKAQLEQPAHDDSNDE